MFPFALHQVTVYIGDCALPFVVLHNEVTLRPRSFVKVAVRFVPVSGKSISIRETHLFLFESFSVPSLPPLSPPPSLPLPGPKEFRSQLIAQTADGKQHTEASLYGSSYWA